MAGFSKTKKRKITPEMRELLRSTASHDDDIAIKASRELAIALSLPLKQGVPDGDTTSDIFESIDFEPGIAPEFPLDFYAPDTEGEYIAYTIPNTGRIPEKRIEGDYIMVPTFDVGASIDWALKYARDARWDIVSRAMVILESMFVRKNNADAWHTILTAAANRGIQIYDNAATAGLFTPRLVALLQTAMERNAGGNSDSVNKGTLSRLYVSPEAVQDMRSWDLTLVDDRTRNSIFIAPGQQGLTSIFGVEIRTLHELGVGQDYQSYFEDTLGGSMSGSKLEICLGLDLNKNDSFVNPMRSPVEIYEDMSFHRARRAGVYAWGEWGWSILDGRRVLLGSL